MTSGAAFVLAFLYQRFVFGTSRTPTGPAEGL